MISPDLTTNDQKAPDSGGPITRENHGERSTARSSRSRNRRRKRACYGREATMAGSTSLTMWRPLDRYDAERHARLGDGQHDRPLRSRPEPGARDGTPIQHRRLHAVHLRNERLRQELDTAHRRRNGIPQKHFVRVVREDPIERACCTPAPNSGCISLSIRRPLGVVPAESSGDPITDMVVHQKDLVLSTQGRSFWILDDLTPLHQWNDQVATAGPRCSSRVTSTAFRRPRRKHEAYVAGINEVTNPRDILAARRSRTAPLGKDAPDGATITAWFDRVPAEELTLEIRDDTGGLVRRYSTRRGSPKTHDMISVQQGMNRFGWDMRHADFVGRRGPLAVPGEYQVKLTAGSWTGTQSFRLLPDPRISTPAADFKAQFDLLAKIRDRVTTIDVVVKRLRTARGSSSTQAARQEAIRQLEARFNDSADDDRLGPPDAPPPLMAQFTRLFGYVAGADAKPTQAANDRFEDLDRRLNEQMGEIDRVLGRVRDASRLYTRACAMLACRDEPMPKPISQVTCRRSARRATCPAAHTRAPTRLEWGHRRGVHSRRLGARRDGLPHARWTPLAGCGAERGDDSHRHGSGRSDLNARCEGLCNRLRPLQWRLLSHHGCGAAGRRSTISCIASTWT